MTMASAPTSKILRMVASLLRSLASAAISSEMSCAVEMQHSLPHSSTWVPEIKQGKILPSLVRMLAC